MKALILLVSALAFGMSSAHAQSDLSRDVLPPPDPSYQSQIEFGVRLEWH